MSTLAEGRVALIPCYRPSLTYRLSPTKNPLMAATSLPTHPAPPLGTEALTLAAILPMLSPNMVLTSEIHGHRRVLLVVLVLLELTPSSFKQGGSGRHLLRCDHCHW